MIRRPPRSTPKPSSAASDVYKRQTSDPLYSTLKSPPRALPRSLRAIVSYDRFSDRAVLSSAEYLGIWFRRTERLGAVHASLRSRSRPEGRRCTHWSDGAESQAFGRAVMRSRHLRLHPDHRLHLNAQFSIPFDSVNLPVNQRVSLHPQAFIATGS